MPTIQLKCCFLGKQLSLGLGLRRIAEQCKRRVMLTGTPLQNDLEELQNLLRFLMPKLFTAQEAEEIANVQVGPLDFFFSSKMSCICTLLTFSWNQSKNTLCLFNNAFSGAFLIPQLIQSLLSLLERFLAGRLDP